MCRIQKLIFHVADPTIPHPYDSRYRTKMVEHAYLASLQLMRLLGPLVTTRQAGEYLDLEGDLHGARVDPRLADPGSILVSAAASV